jgi:alpha-mannosidase
MTAVLFQRLAAQVTTFKEASTVIVWNPHPWKTCDTIEVTGAANKVFDGDGNEIPFELAGTSAVTTGSFATAIRFNTKLPPLGYASYRLENLSTSLAIKDFLKFQYTRTASNHITSKDWEVVIDRESGFITSFYNTREKIEFLGGQGIGPVIIDDESDTWTHALSSYKGAKRKMNLKSYTLVSQGQVSTEYEIVYRLFNSTVILRVFLNGELGKLDLKIRVIWNEHHRLLKFRVGSAFDNRTFTSEIPYGAIERAADGSEWPLQRWAKLSDGTAALAVLNDGIYSGSAEKGSLDLTLLRSPVYAHHEDQHPRPDIYHRYVDQGEHEFHLRLFGFFNENGFQSIDNGEITRRALELNQQPLYVIESSHEGKLPAQFSYCEIKENSSVIISTIKRGEDGDGWVIRAVEAGGKETSAEINFTWLGVKKTFSFSPYEIKTIKIADKDKRITETGLLEF